MSTKVSISYGPDHHLYEECFDQESIYLSISAKEWSYENGEVTVSLPNRVWLKMITDWMNMYGFSDSASAINQCALEAEKFSE
jgi:hypothetical protein